MADPRKAKYPTEGRRRTAPPSTMWNGGGGGASPDSPRRKRIGEHLHGGAQGEAAAQVSVAAAEARRATLRVEGGEGGLGRPCVVSRAGSPGDGNESSRV